MTTILNKEQANYIYHASYLSLCSCLYATYRNYYDFAFVTGIVFLTSINYWRNPINSYRRYIDITAVNTALFYQRGDKTLRLWRRVPPPNPLFY